MTAPGQKRSKGQSLVEFSVVTFLFCMVLLSVVEMGRLILVSSAVAFAARAGMRYAVVHGSSRATGNCVSCASGPSANPPQITTVIDNLARAGALTISRLVITVSYPGASNAPGQQVTITVKYPYDAMTSYIPFRMNLGSTTQGIIAY